MLAEVEATEAATSTAVGERGAPAPAARLASVFADSVWSPDPYTHNMAGALTAVEAMVGLSLILDATSTGVGTEWSLFALCQLALLKFVTSSFVPDEPSAAAALDLATRVDLVVEVVLRVAFVAVALSHASALGGVALCVVLFCTRIGLYQLAPAPAE